MRHAVLIASLAFCSFGKTLYVSPKGFDKGNLTKTTPGKTLQYAIDNSSNGDVVIALSGIYKGMGNHDIDFKGKAVTLKGEDSVTVDAGGGIVAFKFIHDETQATILTNLKILPGDTSKHIRGVNGFYEFSAKANPSITKITIQSGKGQILKTLAIPKAFQQGSGVNRVWNGYDPYHQPSGTTNYWGSTEGSWNSLTTTAARNSWIDKLVARDKTNTFIYDNNYFVCQQFSAQMFISATGYREDLYQSYHDGGPTAFNVPMYMTSIAAPSFGHATNAILIGDNPLNGTNWRFIEPQTDATIVPGNWDMPYGCQINIYSPVKIEFGSASGGTASVIFNVLTDGSFQFVSNSNIQTTRTTPPILPVDNRTDYWGPTVLGIGNGKLMFEQTTPDTNHQTNIMLTKLPYVDPPTAYDLRPSSRSARILDAKLASDGKIRVLWKEATFNPSVYYGVLDTTTNTFSGAILLASAAYNVTEGRLVVISTGNIHAFWTQNNNSTGNIYWSKYNGTSWTAVTAVLPSMHFISDPIFFNHEWKRYVFDVAVTTGSNLMLVYADQDGNYWDYAMRSITYGTSWSTSTKIDSANIRGCQLASLGDGKVQLLYWTGQQNWNPGCERGYLLYRTYNGSTWGSASTIDSMASCVRMAVVAGKICAAWERTPVDTTYPVLGILSGSTWTSRQLKLDINTVAWYPTLGAAATNHLTVTWSARTDSRVGIGTYDTAFSTVVVPSILGDTVIEASGNKLANTIIAYRYQASASFSACSMYVYIKAKTGCKLKLAIYADTNGNPGALLKTTNERTTPYTSIGWKGFALASYLSIQSGKWYWLAYQQDSLYSIAYASTGGSRYQYSQSYGTWPNPAPSGTKKVWKGSIYAK